MDLNPDVVVESVHESVDDIHPRNRQTDFISEVPRIRKPVRIHSVSYPSIIWSKNQSFKRRYNVFVFLDHPDSYLSRCYHITIFIITVLSFLMTVISTNSSFLSPVFIKSYSIIDIGLVVVFFFELVLRIWSSSVIFGNQQKDIYRYLFKPCMIIDIVVILTTIALQTILICGIVADPNAILVLKAVQLLRFFHFERFINALKLIGAVLYTHRSELSAGYLSFLFILFLASFIIYIAELHSSSNEITSVTETIYFTAISFLTIGYGDIVPTTSFSKTLMVILSFLGVALASVPSGIIGAGFALQVSERRKKKKQSMIVKPAIILIQRATRDFFYRTKSENVLENIDYKRVVAVPKFKKFFSYKRVSQAERQDGPAHGNTEIEIIHPGEEQLTVTSIDRFQIRPSKLRNLGPKNVQKQNLIERQPDEIRSVIIKCAEFVRRLQCMAFAKYLREFVEPPTIEEIGEVILSNQKSMNYKLNLLKRELRGSSSGRFSHVEESLRSFSHSNEKLEKKMDKLEVKIDDMEENIRKIISLLKPNST